MLKYMFLALLLAITAAVVFIGYDPTEAAPIQHQSDVTPIEKPEPKTKSAPDPVPKPETREPWRDADLTQTPPECLPSCEGAAIARGEVQGTPSNPEIGRMREEMLEQRAAQIRERQQHEREVRGTS